MAVFAKYVPLSPREPGTRPRKRSATRRDVFFIPVMRYTKQAISLAKQIDTLRERGLIIEDQQEAERRLSLIGYFRLAEYRSVMEADKVQHTFKPHSTFSNVIHLYTFDAELRKLIFSAIQKIEVAMRAKVIYHFSMKHGPFWFMNETLADKPLLFRENLERLRTEVQRSYEDFIKEHYITYDEPDMPPAWKTLEVASFGTLSKLFKNMADPEVKKNVSSDFKIPAYKFLRSWMKSLTLVRNNCAHHTRLWNKRFPIYPKLPQRMPLPWITLPPRAVNSFYPHLCCLAYWLNAIEPNNIFSIELKSLLANNPIVDPRAMGFPDEWQDEPLWK